MLSARAQLPAQIAKTTQNARWPWNTCHWCLDVTYREDESRIRDDNARNNFAWLRRFTLSLLKQHPGKDSIAMKRRGCGWDDAFLIEVLTGKAT